MNLFDNVCTYLYIVNLSKDIVLVDGVELHGGFYH
jgi:hypothetical protein